MKATGKLLNNSSRHIGDKNLYTIFQEVPDFRRKQGRIHELSLILITITMSIMSGYNGLRAMGDFVEKHREELLEIFSPKRGMLPSFQTIARVISNLEFEKLTFAFVKWAKKYVKINEKDYLSIDGKAIGGTVTNPHNKFQQYTNLVSLFSSKRKQVIAFDKVDDKGSEIPIVKSLIKELDLEGVVFTLDALHCQKDTVKTVIDSKNDYIIGVKGNQKKLHSQIIENTEKSTPIAVNKMSEKNRGRIETRIAEVYDNIENINNKWSGLQSIIKIERIVERNNDVTNEVAYYISSLPPSTGAKEFNSVIRGHWLIENSLHYTKDKTFKEDESKITKGYAPQNISTMRNIAINIFRENGYKNMAQAIRLVANDIVKLLNMILA
ncbi:MAG: ISAs1 family transposase [Bacteroidetes bacterium]|nr:ISAs1 family transposase [Bacteroidota bacterium]